MATPVTINSNYAGQFAGEYIGASLLAGTTLSQGLITIKPNVKFKETISKVDYTSAISSATCDFTSGGAVELIERVITPTELQINLELCKLPFQSDWEAESMGFSATDVLPPLFSDFFIARVLADVAQATEQQIWSGSAGAGTFDGFETLFADAQFTTDGGITIAPVAGGINAGNVVAELGKVSEQISNANYAKSDLYLYVAQNVWRSYKSSLGGFQANGVGANGVNGLGNNQDVNILYFDGIKIVVAGGLSDDRIVGAEKSNLFFATGLMSDYNSLSVLDMAMIDGSKNVRFVARYTAGVQYGIASDIVYYGA